MFAQLQASHDDDAFQQFRPIVLWRADRRSNARNVLVLG
jgi:hypothetical protein